MADIQHSTLPSASVHEPKHITVNGTGASGRVITNSSNTSGISEYRRLTGADLQDIPVEIPVLEIDASTAQTHYIPATFSGTITQLTAVVNNSITTASNTYELRIDGVTVTGSALTLDTSSGTGGDAGDSVSSTASGNNIFSAGQVITLVHTSTGNTDADVDVRFVISATRD